ncbi:putative secreted protein, partial [Sesbania bispinosa]
NLEFLCISRNSRESHCSLRHFELLFVLSVEFLFPFSVKLLFPLSIELLSTSSPCVRASPSNS